MGIVALARHQFLQIVAAYFSGTGETFYDAAGLRFELTGQIAAP